MSRLASLASLASIPFVLAACADVPSSSEEDGQEESAGEEESDSESDSGTGEQEGLAQTTTWHQHVAPIVAERCGGCHRSEGIAPFSLGDYDSASQWAELGLEAIHAGTMPPFGAADTEECAPRLPFKDDPRLTEDQLALFEDWILDGKPEGDPDEAAPLPELPDLDLADPDFHLEMEGDITIEPGSDQFWCFVMDPELTETTFIDGLQITPDNDKIVHHVLLYLDEGGTQSENLAGDDGRYECFGGPGLSNPTLLAAWAPGVPPTETPEAVAMNIPAGSRFVMNVHYHPTGVEEVDTSTGVDVRIEKGAPQYFGQLALIGNFSSSLGGGMDLQPGPNDSTSNPEFRIPAGISDHTETMIFRLPNSFPDVKLWSTGTHMHYVGTSMYIGLDRQEPEANTGIDAECLLNTPNYNFEWQRGYSYDAPLDEVPTAKAGDFIFMECGYDNSMGNPLVAEALDEQGLDAPVDVFLGEETLDEMCLGVFGIAYSIVP